jgi:hypothetical protein
MSEGFFLFGEIVGTSESLAIGDRVVAGTIVRDGHQLIVFTPVSR